MTIGVKRMVDPLRARLLLILGGPLGFHRLYLNQIPEAFIYLSTFGVFLIGVFYDSFILHSLVEQYNNKFIEDENEKDNLKYRNGKPLPTVSKHVEFSVKNVIFSTLYGIWLGLLCWIAGKILLGDAANDSLLLLSASSAAVSAGIYVFGNRSGQTRNLLYVWISSFSTAFISKLLNGSCLRTLFLASLAGTVIGNRSAKIRSPNEKSFNIRHFVFWASLFFLLLCIIFAAGTRHILEKKVAAHKTGESTIISSIGSLTYDRFFKPSNVRNFFKDSPIIEYKNLKNNPKKKDEWWDIDLIGNSPSWATYITVFIVDLLRAETKVEEKLLKVEPLRWTAWRMYLINHFNVPPTVSDKELEKICFDWIIKSSQKLKDDETFIERSLTMACSVIRS